MKKICTKCHIEKDTNLGGFQNRKTPKGTIYFRAECKSCRSIFIKQYYINNKDNIITVNSKYRKINSSKRNELVRIRKTNDVSFKINSNIISLIKITIKRNGGNKNKQPTLKHLDYSILDLKFYLESKFESWMSWSNWGVYDSKTWNDQDYSTWTWQLDHIIPQSNLPYTSLNDDNFKKNWSLENLRPLSSKQNILDGANKVRHLKEAV